MGRFHVVVPVDQIAAFQKKFWKAAFGLLGGRVLWRYKNMKMKESKQ